MELTRCTAKCTMHTVPVSMRTVCTVCTVCTVYTMYTRSRSACKHGRQL